MLLITLVFLLYLSLRLIFRAQNDVSKPFQFNHHKSFGRGSRLLLSSKPLGTPLLRNSYEWTMIDDVDGYRGNRVNVDHISDSRSNTPISDKSPVRTEPAPSIHSNNTSNRLKSTLDKFMDVNAFASPYTDDTQDTKQTSTDTTDTFFHQNDELYISSTHFSPNGVIRPDTQSSIQMSNSADISQLSQLIKKATKSDALPLS